jgi:Phosphate transport regulator (distant homolog of PhoU)
VDPTEQELMVKLSLTPKENVYFTLLADCAAQLVEAARVLAEVAAADRPSRAALVAELHGVEHAADEAVHALIQKVNSSFVTPLDRHDLLLLATGIDDCVDLMDEAGDMILLYKVGTVPDATVRIIAILERCAQLTVEVVPRLRSMQRLRDYCLEINRLENEADRIYRQAIADLFDMDTDGRTLVKLKDIILTLEAAVDAFERLANSVETIAVKES